ncbi:MAG TPA: hypothetical protein VFK06_00255 [Candidatus Angelobacter sp.]|nr:hypothetical protein [Candidatus Angelobacter sp.]
MTSWKIPTPELVDKAVASMVRLEQQRYFFERLNNPKWIQPLQKKGWFAKPPSPKRDEERGTIEFQEWPALKYLSRMAAHEPELVARVMQTIHAADNNPYIIQSFLSAALAMPPEIADRLTPQAVKLVQSPYIMRAHIAGDLAVHLARGGKENSALTLLRTALYVVPDPRSVAETLKTVDPNYQHEAQMRMPYYEYQLIIQRCGVELVKLLGISFVELLCTILEGTLSLEKRRKSGAKTIEDFSYIWCSNLSSLETTQSPKRFLAPAVLQYADVYASQGPEQLEKIRDVLANRSFKVFRRIELELLTRHHDFAGSALSEKLVDKDAFDDVALRYEYDDLSAKAFGMLTVHQQEQILQWIDDGLNLKLLVQRGFSEADAQEVSEKWQFERLTPVKEFLANSWKERYETLHDKYGDPLDRRLIRGGAFQFGSKSPKQLPELAEMSVSDVMEYLMTWRPNPNESLPFSPSEEGLGAVLTETVAKRPAEFSEQIGKLKETDPTYVRSAIQGFESAVRSKAVFDWTSVLVLALWVVRQPIEIPGRTGDHWTKDPDWGWARAAIVSLIEQGFREKAIPFALRETAWSIIAALVEAKEDIKELPYTDPDSQSKDIWSHSVNRTEARAMRIAVQYIEWCRNNLHEPHFSLASVPEAEKLLSNGLDTNIQPSLDIRLIYGELLPFLISIDRLWIQNKKFDIFPAEPEKQPLRDIAWVAYLTANYAYNAAFEDLSDIYLSAVQDMGKSRQVGSGHMVNHPEDGLIHHLMQLYWNGRIGLEDNGILDIFLKQASDELLGRMVTYLGRSLKETKELSNDEVKRLESLWDRSISWPDDSKHKRELAAYGWWFNSNHFEDHWALEHIYKSLQLSHGGFEPKLGTLERFMKLAEQYSKLVMQSTQLVVNADFENVILWHDDLKKILSIALKSGDLEAMKTARLVIQNLGTRGHLQYRTLLAE